MGGSGGKGQRGRLAQGDEETHVVGMNYILLESDVYKDFARVNERPQP